MSALERVIEEQQAEIDRHKEVQRLNIEAWEKENRRREALVEAVFIYMGNPEDWNAKQLVWNAIKSWGYCITCEACPCECDYE